MMDPVMFEKLMDAVIVQESGGNPLAESHAGAQGLMQLMPKTAKETMEDLGMDSNAYDPFDPIMNRTIGTAYLRKMLGLFGELRLALAAYNAGPGRISRLTQKYGDRFKDIQQYLPTETKGYVENITYNLLKKGVIA